MKFTCTIFLLTLISLQSYSQSGQWAWMKGDSTYGAYMVSPPPPVWGTKGVGDPDNTPPIKIHYYEWQDSSGNFWIYGGLTAYSQLGYNDLWKFDLISQNWIWMQGDSTMNTPASYGVQGIPSPDNTPGLRYWGGLSWTGKDGKFWLASSAPENDDIMMMYDPVINEWTWMSGSTSTWWPFYGTKGIASPDNTPGAFALEATGSWVDNDGDLWFFQGAALWKYDVGTLEWTWMSGDSVWDTPGVYGALGVSDENNHPGQRIINASWKDNEGNFWLFGGDYMTMAGDHCYNDLWRYNPSTNEWTWMGGDSIIDQYGNSGSDCEHSTSFVPGARYRNRAAVADSCGNFWMYGGYYVSNSIQENYCDLWIYRPQFNDWSQLSSNCNRHFGTKGIPDVSNSPGVRLGSVAWLDNEGNMWLFGGAAGIDAVGQDLWKFIPNPDCSQSNCIPTFANDILTSEDDLKIYPNPSAGIFTVEFSSLGNFSIEVRNVVGQIILSSEEENVDGHFKKLIDLNRQPSGIYFLGLKNADQQWVEKILIQ